MQRRLLPTPADVVANSRCLSRLSPDTDAATAAYCQLRQTAKHQACLSKSLSVWLVQVSHVIGEIAQERDSIVALPAGVFLT